MTQEFVTLPREVVEQALDALKYERTANNPLDWHHDKTMQALRAALEQPQDEHEPVAWALSHSKGLEFSSAYPMQKSKQAAEQMARQHMGAVTVSPLYTHPQPAQKPLTDDQVLKAVRHLYQSDLPVGMGFSDDLDVARAIEAAHNIK